MRLVVATLPQTPTLLSFWASVNKRPYEGTQVLASEQWVGCHHVMSEEEYVETLSGIFLNVVLKGTNHAGYHLGELMLWRSNQS